MELSERQGFLDSARGLPRMSVNVCMCRYRSRPPSAQTPISNRPQPTHGWDLWRPAYCRTISTLMGSSRQTNLYGREVICSNLQPKRKDLVILVYSWYPRHIVCGAARREKREGEEEEQAEGSLLRLGRWRRYGAVDDSNPTSRQNVMRGCVTHELDKGKGGWSVRRFWGRHEW